MVFVGLSPVYVACNWEEEGALAGSLTLQPKPMAASIDAENLELRGDWVEVYYKAAYTSILSAQYVDKGPASPTGVALMVLQES